MHWINFWLETERSKESNYSNIISRLKKSEFFVSKGGTGISILYGGDSRTKSKDNAKAFFNQCKKEISELTGKMVHKHNNTNGELIYTCKMIIFNSLSFNYKI